jgi:hypothetical protein
MGTTPKMGTKFIRPRSLGCSRSCKRTFRATTNQEPNSALIPMSDSVGGHIGAFSHPRLVVDDPRRPVGCARRSRRQRVLLGGRLIVESVPNLGALICRCPRSDLPERMDAQISERAFPSGSTTSTTASPSAGTTNLSRSRPSRSRSTSRTEPSSSRASRIRDRPRPSTPLK